jgi:hypothetical protein
MDGNVAQANGILDLGRLRRIRQQDHPQPRANLVLADFSRQLGVSFPTNCG